MSTDHVHKYNATLIDSHGRCSCGSWARYDRRAKRWGAEYDPRYAKGLETRLRRLKDPGHSYAPILPRESGPRFADYEAATVPDVVEVIDGTRRRPS